jgi:hypothetical protein
VFFSLFNGLSFGAKFSTKRQATDAADKWKAEYKDDGIVAAMIVLSNYQRDNLLLIQFIYQKCFEPLIRSIYSAMPVYLHKMMTDFIDQIHNCNRYTCSKIVKLPYDDTVSDFEWLFNAIYLVNNQCIKPEIYVMSKKYFPFHKLPNGFIKFGFEKDDIVF